jgi:hypothetical protein
MTLHAKYHLRPSLYSIASNKMKCNKIFRCRLHSTGKIRKQSYLEVCSVAQGQWRTFCSLTISGRFRRVATTCFELPEVSAEYLQIEGIVVSIRHQQSLVLRFQQF